MSAPWANDGRWHRIRPGEDVATVVDGSPSVTFCGRLLGYHPTSGQVPVYRDSERGKRQVRERCAECESQLELMFELVDAQTVHGGAV